MAKEKAAAAPAAKGKKGARPQPGETKANAKKFPKIVKKRNQTPKGKHGGMELMLTEDVTHLGKQGEIVEVKPGYGRNYLLPQGLATYVSPQAKIRIEKLRQKMEALRIARQAELKITAKRLEQVTINIEANANEEGQLYGSVSGADIAAGVSQQGYQITEDNVKLEGVIKQLGLYQVRVELDPEVSAEIKVWVVATGSSV